MGYHTDFIGYVEVVPPLEEREIASVNRIFLVPGAAAEGVPALETCGAISEG